MSTAFLVDNILNDKEDNNHDSLMSDTSDSDTTSTDLKDSLCDSPPTLTTNNCENGNVNNGKLSLSENFLRTYTMIKDTNCSVGIEVSCTKCGYYQFIKRGNGQSDFKCEKCDCCEYNTDKDETIIKEASKPVLKFSVSAILGDKKDCVKVRNGKCFFFEE